MKYAKTLVVITMLAMTPSLLLLSISTSDSFAQNDTATMSNQSSSTYNETAMSNQTESGNISALSPRGQE